MAVMQSRQIRHNGDPVARFCFDAVLTAAMAVAAWRTRARATAPRLTRIVRTEIADAHREYLTGSLCLDDRIIGYQRLVSPPAYGRCLILAGQRYTFGAGFKRHPGCAGCTHVPIYHLPGRGEVSGIPDDHPPRALFGQMTSPQQLAAPNGDPDAVKAVNDGVDMFAVVNGQRRQTAVRIRRTEARIARSLGFTAPADLIVHNAERARRSLAYLRARHGDNPRALRTALAREGWLTEALHTPAPPGGIT